MSVDTSPASPLEGQEVTLSLSSTQGTALAFEIVSVPSLSAIGAGMLLSTQASGTDLNIGILDAVDRGLTSLTFTPDVPGEYVVRGFDLVEIVSTASYLGDPAGEPRHQLMGSQTGTIQVGETVDLPIVSLFGDGATLRLGVVGSTISSAALVNSTSEKGRVAALDPDVVTWLGAIVGFTADTAGTDLQAAVNDLRLMYNRHRVDAVHVAGPDSTNEVNTTDANSTSGAILLLNELREAIMDHMLTASAAAVSWHTEDDLRNLPLSQAASSVAQATVLAADLRLRSYARHRQQDGVAPTPPAPFDDPNCHDGADAAAALAVAPSMLDNIIVSFLDAVANADPSAPTGESQGLVDALYLYGFK